MYRLLVIAVVLSTVLLGNVKGDGVHVELSTSSVTLEIGHSYNVSLNISHPLSEEAIIYFTYQEGDIIRQNQSYEVIAPLPNLVIPANGSEEHITLTAVEAGNVIIGLNSSSSEFEDLRKAYIRVDVVHYKFLDIISIIIGWIYFIAWSISFYPQTILNWQRKSVVGLNFDFVAFNLTGFLAYSAFNVGFYWFPAIYAMYQEQHPRDINPVQVNDVFFSLHAVVLTLVVIVQILMYDRGGQQLSRVCAILLTLMWLFAGISLIVALCNKISWLEYLYFFSYIKLAVTLVKYVPQAYMNFLRKSTDGWSIGNILLDFTGGSFSLLQMTVLAYNNNDWSSIFGNPTKFGLGAFSIFFDIIFMIQHYILYRPSKASKEECDPLFADEEEKPVNCDTYPPRTPTSSHSDDVHVIFA